MKPVYPYFGGKRRVADLAWQAFGEPHNYVEPFLGGAAVLLARPAPWHTETVNDISGWLCNFWRSVKSDPDAVAWHASDPVSELDLHARGDAMFYRGVGWYKGGKLSPDEFCERLRSDPEWCDHRIAGWWVWGQSSWIGDGWTRNTRDARRPKGTGLSADGQVARKTPRIALPGVCLNGITACGTQVHRKVPHLGSGQGLNAEGVADGQVRRSVPHLATGGAGLNAPGVADEEPDGEGVLETSRLGGIRGCLRLLADRVAKVRVCCGDWRRVCTNAVTTYHGETAVFLDPPYPIEGRHSVYGEDETECFNDVAAWCGERGGDPLLRIILCGHEGDWTPPPGWRTHAWTGLKGYAKVTENKNRELERMWLSPACLPIEDEEHTPRATAD